MRQLLREMHGQNRQEEEILHGDGEIGILVEALRWAREVRTSALTELGRISERERMGRGFSPKEVADALKRLEASEATLQQITERLLKRMEEVDDPSSN